MKALSNSLKVYCAFATDRGRWSVSDLCAYTGLSKSNVSKILADFRDAELLVQDPDTREYSVGLLSLALANNFLASQRLVHESVGPLRRLASELDHTVVVAVLHQGRVMYLLSFEGQHFVDVGMRLGAWLPAHATAVGKALFAFASPSGDPLLPDGEYKRFTPNTITTRKALAAELARVRKEGVAFTNAETAPGLAAIGVPVFQEGGTLAAALGIVYPQHAVNAKLVERYVKSLRTAARQISVKLGAVVYPFGDH